MTVRLAEKMTIRYGRFSQEGEETEGVTAHGDHDVARSRAAVAPQVVPDYTIWSQINVDEVDPWEGPGPRVQLGGGSYVCCAWSSARCAASANGQGGWWCGRGLRTGILAVV